MIIVNYKSKRQLKKAIGGSLDYIQSGAGGAKYTVVKNDDPFFVTNWDRTFKATVIMVDGKIESVR